MKKRLLVVVAIVVIAIVSYPLWKNAARRNKWFLIATNVAQDSLRRWGLNSGQIGKVRAIYDQYLHYAGWTPGSVRGKRVIELGPGYTIGVPLMFAADGADYVVGLDKFVPLATGSDFGLLYSRMRDTLTDAQKAGFDRAIALQPAVALKAAHAPYIDQTRSEK